MGNNKVFQQRPSLSILIRELIILRIVAVSVILRIISDVKRFGPAMASRSNLLISCLKGELRLHTIVQLFELHPPGSCSLIAGRPFWLSMPSMDFS